MIVLDDILTIVSEKNIFKDSTNRTQHHQQQQQLLSGSPSQQQQLAIDNDKPANWFEIITKKVNYLICADSEQEMHEWVEAIEFVISQREQLIATTIGSFEVRNLARGLIIVI